VGIISNWIKRVDPDKERINMQIQLWEMQDYTNNIVSHIWQTRNGSIPDDTFETFFSLTEEQKGLVFLSLLGIIQGLTDCFPPDYLSGHPVDE
jgi:hypothetical protein